MFLPKKHVKIFLSVLFLLFVVHLRVTGQLKLAPVSVSGSYENIRLNARIAADDTLMLPVWDDFSYGGGLPDPDIWINSSGVYINYSSGINPPSLGVATFDGASANAGIYDLDPFKIGKADSLVSKPVNLGSLGSDEINTVYLSFFWEFFGHPEIPDAEDSLILSFRNQQSVWEVIDVFTRDQAASSDTFQYVIYKVEPKFLHSSFQFKLSNVARLSGPYDSWHIDYIYLDKGRSLTDRAVLDRAISTVPDYLFDRYSAMPMDQFLANPSKFLIPARVDIFNLDALLQPIEFTAILKNSFNKMQVIDTLNFNTEVNPPIQGFQRRTLETNLIDLNNLDLNSDSIYLTMDFYISSGDSISENGINYRVNDTTTFDYVLDNYYATDDGTAEFGLGMEQTDAKLAYMFVLEEPDVLNRVDFHFPNIGRLQTGSAFNVMVWKRLSDNPDDLLFERSDVVVEPISDFNQFQSIRLSDVFVADTFYIGYEQQTSEFLAVGFDKQHDSGDRIFFNVLGSWQANEEFHGSLMIRPYFGDAAPTALFKEQPPHVRIYPNPTRDLVRVEGETDRIELFNIMGKKLLELTHPGPDKSIELNLIPYGEGMYILRIYTGEQILSEKIMFRP